MRTYESDPDMTYASHEQLGALYTKMSEWLTGNMPPTPDDLDDITYLLSVDGDVLGRLLPTVAVSFPDISELSCLFKSAILEEGDGECTFYFDMSPRSQYEFRSVGLSCPDITGDPLLAVPDREDMYRQRLPTNTAMSADEHMLSWVKARDEMREAGLFEITMTEYEALELIVNNLDALKAAQDAASGHAT